MEDTTYVLDDQIGYLLRRVTQRHLAIFAEHVPAVTTRQFAVLARLASIGPLSQNLLGRETSMDAATIKGVVNRLEKQGLVITTPDANDRRRLIVALSDDGAAVFERTKDQALKVSRLTLAGLSAAEADRLMALLQKLA